MKNWQTELKTRSKWDKRFMQLTYCVRGWSKDSRPVGVVLVDADRRVISTGYNGFPKGIADSAARLACKEVKRDLMIHAEVNALLNAVSDTTGSTLYATRFPCHECAKLIIQKGISRIVSKAPELEHEAWGSSHKLALDLFAEANIEVSELG